MVFVVSKRGHGRLLSPAQPAALAARELDVHGRPGFCLPVQVLPGRAWLWWWIRGCKRGAWAGRRVAICFPSPRHCFVCREPPATVKRFWRTCTAGGETVASGKRESPLKARLAVLRPACRGTHFHDPEPPFPGTRGGSRILLLHKGNVKKKCRT